MVSKTPTILFMGTPEFAATALRKLVESGFNVIGVVTRPDTHKGRGGHKGFSEVKTAALKLKLPFFQPENKTELTKIVQNSNPELVVVAAYGMIVPKEVLEIPKYGALNIHGSLLPAYRGASPITEAILNGDDKTGITIMKMTVGMDEGPIIKKVKVKIKNNHTTETLTEEMAELGANAIVETIPGWISGELKGTPQNDTKATYCKKIVKEDGHIDWHKPAEQVERMVRAYTPWPTAYTFVEEQRIKIISSRHCEEKCDAAISDIGILHFESGHIYVGTGDGTLEILELQPEGKKPMSARDFINGNKGLDGTKLS
jgi:methionyl-tRNA formyltransferase